MDTKEMSLKVVYIAAMLPFLPITDLIFYLAFFPTKLSFKFRGSVFLTSYIPIMAFDSDIWVSGLFAYAYGLFFVWISCVIGVFLFSIILLEMFSIWFWRKRNAKAVLDYVKEG